MRRAWISICVLYLKRFNLVPRSWQIWNDMWDICASVVLITAVGSLKEAQFCRAKCTRPPGPIITVDAVIFTVALSAVMLLFGCVWRQNDEAKLLFSVLLVKRGLSGQQLEPRDAQLQPSLFLTQYPFYFYFHFILLLERSFRLSFPVFLFPCSSRILSLPPFSLFVFPSGLWFALLGNRRSRECCYCGASMLICCVCPCGRRW